MRLITKSCPHGQIIARQLHYDFVDCGGWNTFRIEVRKSRTNRRIKEWCSPLPRTQRSGLLFRKTYLRVDDNNPARGVEPLTELLDMTAVGKTGVDGRGSSVNFIQYYQGVAGLSFDFPSSIPTALKSRT